HRDLLCKWWCAWKKPLETRRQMTNRIKFAKGRNGWSVSKWKTVLWSDEAIFTVTSNGSGKVRRHLGSDTLDRKYTCATVKRPDKIMLWGCFRYYSLDKLIVSPKNETVHQN
ncbi:unnamed protein product, partial [Meganyctiphanes norvegica]